MSESSCGYDSVSINAIPLRERGPLRVSSSCACAEQCHRLTDCYFWTYELATGNCIRRSHQSMEFPLMRLLPRKGVISGDRASLANAHLPPGTFRHLFVRHGARTYGTRSVSSCQEACVTDERCLAWSVYGESSMSELTSSSRMTCRLHNRQIYPRFQRVPRIEGKRVAMGLSPRFRSDDACSRVSYQLRKDSMCFELEQAPLNDTCSSFSEQTTILPRLYHAIGPRTRPKAVSMNAVANPSYRLNYHDDDSAPAYLRKHCGVQVAEAFRCFVAPANRADLFRFCALYAQGGVYLDADLILTAPMERLVLPCAQASVGRDIPQRGLPGSK